jgi:hypothetical protein
MVYNCDCSEMRKASVCDGIRPECARGYHLDTHGRRVGDDLPGATTSSDLLRRCQSAASLLHSVPSPQNSFELGPFDCRRAYIMQFIVIYARLLDPQG